ncbi:MAG: hypothetical protein Q9165_003193 [Trypethelium subeluteriae]
MIRRRLRNWSIGTRDRCTKEGKLEQLEYYSGVSKFYELLISHLPLSKASSSAAGSDPEQFFVSPPDNNLQNILADERGNITGFIDWDSIESLPAYLSWAGQPIFLRADWMEEYDWPVVSGQSNSPTELAHYRKQYARYLAEACGGTDCRITGFTEKSAMFQALWDSFGTGHHEETARKFLEVLLPRVDMYGHMSRLGVDWLDGEEAWIHKEVEALFAPNLMTIVG